MKKITILLFIHFCFIGLNGQDIISSSTIQPTNSKKWKAPHLAEIKISTIKLAEKGNVNAMFKLGLIYRNNDEFSKAIRWFQDATKLGHSQAAYYLGLMFKRGEGVKIDYQQAYKYFSISADRNNSMGEYSKGYMLFKGLGCIQDYKAAYAMFEKNVLEKGTNCLGKMYMLGICLRNGYGTEVNVDSALYWLKKSASLGYSPSTEELSHKSSENNNDTKYFTTEEFSGKPTLMLQGKNESERSNLPGKIAGNYEGNLIKYDWSGTNIIEVSKLLVDIKLDNGNVIGTWSEPNNDLNIELKGDVMNDTISFVNMQYYKRDHYNINNPALYKFKQADFTFVNKDDTSYLEGKLLQYNIGRKEPSNPTRFVLKKKLEYNECLDENEKQLNDSISIYPNPFIENFTIQFEINVGCMVKVQVFAADGRMVYFRNNNYSKPGKYLLPINLKASPGVYFLKASIGDTIRATLLLKR